MLSLGCSAAQGQTFYKIDAEGQLHWASHPIDPTFQRSGGSTMSSHTNKNVDALRLKGLAAQSRDDLLDVIVEASRRHGVDPAWVLALIETESNFNTRATSPRGARGLMQLMPDTAKRYGLRNIDELFRPEVNLDIGILHLKALLNRHQNNWPVVLAAYNAGENAVIRRGNRIPGFRETLLYVPAIIARVEPHRMHLDALGDH